MQNFYYKEQDCILPIKEYRPEYEGNIYCEDCRQPIKFVAGTGKIRPYFRIISPNKHDARCKVCSKNNRGKTKRTKYIVIKDEIPVLSLNLGLKKNKTKRKTNNPVKNEQKQFLNLDNIKSEILRREHLDTFDKVLNRANSEFDKWDTSKVRVGNKIRTLKEVIYRPEYIVENLNSLLGTNVYMTGYVFNYLIHQHVPHVSLYVDTEGKGFMKVFIHSNIAKYQEIGNFLGSNILCYGKVNRYGYSPQIEITSFEHISQIMNKKRKKIS